MAKSTTEENSFVSRCAMLCMCIKLIQATSHMENVIISNNCIVVNCTYKLQFDCCLRFYRATKTKNNVLRVDHVTFIELSNYKQNLLQIRICCTMYIHQIDTNRQELIIINSVKQFRTKYKKTIETHCAYKHCYTVHIHQ